MKRLSTAPLKVRYLVVGAWNTFVGFAVFTFFMFLLPVSQYLLAFLLTTLFSGTNAYLTQRIFVWKSSASIATEASKFFTVFIGQTIANIFLLFAFVDYFNFHPLWTQYVIAVVFIVLTYLSHKHWTFKSK